MPPEAELLDRVIGVVHAAGALVLAVYATEFEVATKPDLSPVTEADRRAGALLEAELARITPGVPVICEDAAAPGGARPVADRFWLVDPLDGTREFVARNGEFTVNVALVVRGEPQLGVVLAPAAGRLFAGVAGGGAFEEVAQTRFGLACRRVPDAGLTVVASRAHGDAEALAAFLAGRPVAAQRGVGSSLKFCLVAAGAADLYPRFGPTMEWDTAAGHAVLRAAGGRVSCLDGSELRYGKRGFINPPFVATGAAP